MLAAGAGERFVPFKLEDQLVAVQALKEVLGPLGPTELVIYRWAPSDIRTQSREGAALAEHSCRAPSLLACSGRPWPPGKLGPCGAQGGPCVPKLPARDSSPRQWRACREVRPDPAEPAGIRLAEPAVEFSFSVWWVLSKAELANAPEDTSSWSGLGTKAFLSYLSWRNRLVQLGEPGGGDGCAKAGRRRRRGGQGRRGAHAEQARPSPRGAAARRATASHLACACRQVAERGAPQAADRVRQPGHLHARQLHADHAHPAERDAGADAGS